ncbi:hypothetical protein D1AOALGA4SA_4580 [Olavius algarvensis Delta 1 endosymbiont]|nr:hypothetical protein D1AOALGA4SA_4580 [Olavius algarvensis Delta 1 endosymbiont]
MIQIRKPKRLDPLRKLLKIAHQPNAADFWPRLQRIKLL